MYTCTPIHDGILHSTDIWCTKILYNIWQCRLKFYADGAKELVGQISSFCQSSQIPDLSLYHDDHPRQCTCNPPCVYNKVHIIQDWCTQIAQKPGQNFIQWGVMHWVIPRHQCLVAIKYNLLWNSYNINIILEWESSAKFPSINFSRCTKLHHPLISNWLFVPLHFLINAFNNLDSDQYLKVLVLNLRTQE